MSRCPSLQQLEDLLEEQLADADQRSVSAHVAGCALCQEALAHLTGEADALAASSSSARRRAGDLPAVDDPASAFLTRLKQTPPSAGSSEANGLCPFPAAARSRSGPAEVPSVEGYEIVGELGRGGMGVVYKARQVALDRPVALKMILHAAHAGGKDLARFRREVEAAARLHHPNIVQVHDVGESGGRPFFAMEFVEGGSLSQRLRGDPQPLAAAARLIETLARAIHFAHQQHVVHRDLKPGNILLSPSVHSPRAGADLGDTPLADYGLPKITDFGLAKRLDGAGGGTHTGELVGTPSYMAPEQAGGKAHEIGPAADVYALGAILYELLTGRPPFKGATPLDTVLQVRHEEPVRPGRLRPRLPRDLETICLKCLEKEPRKRYASAEALADDLRRFRHGTPIQARPVGPVERAAKWAARRPLTAALLGGMILSVVLGFTGVTWQWRVAVSEKQQKERERQTAEGEREKADKARLKADAARQRYGDALYFSRIVDSQLQWRVNAPASARDTLSLCRPSRPAIRDRRGWEWYYLHGLYNTALWTRDLPRGEQGGDVAFSPDGQSIAAAASGVRVWGARNGPLLQAFARPDTVNRLAYHPDGRRLALGATDGRVLVRDVVTGKELRRSTPHAQMVTGLAFSPDGRLLASASWDQTVKVCDADTGKVRTTFTGHRDRVQCVAFHPDGLRLASGGWDGAVQVWNTDGGNVRTLTGHKSPVSAIAFSPDGKLLASAADNGNLKIWEVADGRVIQSLTGQTGGILSLAFSPDGRFVAYGGGDGTVRVWHVKAAVEFVTYRGHTAGVGGVAFSPDGRRVASSSPREGLVKVWDLTRHPEHATFARTGLGPRAGAGQKVVGVRDLLRRPRQVTDARTGPDVEALAFAQDGRRLVSLTVGGKLQTWDAANGLLLQERSLDTARELVTPAVLAAFGPGGKRLAARAQDAKVVKVWDVVTGELAYALPAQAAPVFCVRFSGDGRRLATCTCDLDRPDGPHEIKVWDAESGKLLASLPGRGQVFDLAFTPDGGLLARAGEDGTVGVAELATGKDVFQFRGHEGGVSALGVSPDGTTLASAGVNDRAVRLWDLSARGPEGGVVTKAVRVLKAPAYLCDLEFCPPQGPRQGLRLVGISRDLVQMWDAQTGQAILTLRGAPHRHWDPPFNPRVTFSPDGSRLAGTNWDESISVWDAPEQTDDRSLERNEAARRRAAERRAPFWHLQEAEYCLEHQNRAAARFHLTCAGKEPLPPPVEARRQQLLQRLNEK